MLKVAMMSVLSSAVLLVGCAAPASRPGPRFETAPIFISTLGQPAGRGRRIITATAVLEDSRCPANANCVHAGTVRLKVTITGSAGERMGEVGLGKPLATEGDWLHLVRVCPDPVAPVQIMATQYRFHFALAARAILPAVATDCI